MTCSSSLSRWAVIGAVTVFAAVAPAPGRSLASPTTHTGELSRHLPADAPIIVRLDPSQTPAAGAYLEKAGMANLRRTVRFAGWGARALLGFDPFKPAGWNAAGVDAKTGVLIAVGAHHAGAQLVWHRAALRLTNPTKAAGSIASVLDLTPGFTRLATARSAWLAAVFSLAPNQVAAMKQQLAARGVIAVGSIPVSPGSAPWLVIAHVKASVAVFDVWAPSVAAEPASSGATIDSAHLSVIPPQVLQTLDRAPSASGYADQLARGAAARVLQQGSALWINPQWLASTADDAKPLCRQLSSQMRAGVFTDVAFGLSWQGNAMTLRTVWGLRGKYQLASAFVVQDDGFANALSLRDGAIAAAGLYLRSFAPLRALQRSAEMKGGIGLIRRTITACGPRTMAGLALLTWPQLLGMMLDEVASVHPDAEVMSANLRNVAVRVWTLATELPRLVAGLSVSVNAPAAEPLRKMLAAVFGAGSSASGASRSQPSSGSYTTWGTGPLRPFATGTAGGKHLFGMAVGARALAGYRKNLSRSTPTPPGTVASWVVDTPALLDQLTSGGGNALLDWLGPALGGLGKTTGRMHFRGDTLDATFTIVVK